jgi:ParB family chromosome partitioning protein
MLDSIEQYGLWQPLLVRPQAEGLYELVDGHYRYSCCKRLKWDSVPCIIRNLSAQEVLVAQLQANGIRPETSPVEFADRLRHLMALYPDLTAAKLARLINKSPNWIRNILRLNALRPEYKERVRQGELTLKAGYILAKLPHELQDVYIKQAIILKAKDFENAVKAEVRRVREAVNNCYIDTHPFNNEQPVPHMRKVVEIMKEFETPSEAGPVLLKAQASTALEGWATCLAWILHMDPDSLEVQEQLIKQRRAKKEHAAQRRKKERENLKKLRQEHGNDFIDLDY